MNGRLLICWRTCGICGCAGRNWYRCPRLGRNLQLDVSDNRPGFPRGQEQTIFDKFARGNKESAVPGVGLGLAICRAIVDVHGGTYHRVDRSCKVVLFLCYTSPANCP
ncbi:ATP-binding protein [Shigella flexneri]